MKLVSQSILSSSTHNLAVTPGLSSIANTTVNQTPTATSTGGIAFSTWCRWNARSRLTDPAIAGITLGTIVVVILAVCFVVWLSRKLRARNTQKRRQSALSPDTAHIELGSSGNPPITTQDFLSQLFQSHPNISPSNIHNPPPQKSPHLPVHQPQNRPIH